MKLNKNGRILLVTIHLSILSLLIQFRVVVMWSYPSCHRVRSRVHPGPSWCHGLWTVWVLLLLIIGCIIYICPLSPSILSSLIKYYLVYSLLCFILFCFLWSKYQMCTEAAIICSIFRVISVAYMRLWEVEKVQGVCCFTHLKTSCPLLSEEHAQPCVRRLRAPWRLACPARSGPHSHSLTCASDR